MFEIIEMPVEEAGRLDSFFLENGLEVSDEEPVETGLIKTWKVEDEKGGLLAAICLAFREGEHIIDGIAVDEKLRGQKIGERMLSLAVEETRKRGGKHIYLVARAPEFFRKQGFVTVSQEDAPLFYECAGCDQFNVSCFPEIMDLEV